MELSFEPADLAGLVWVAIAVLALAEAVRYWRHGRRPGSRMGRAVLLAVLGGALVALTVTGRLAILHISHGWACLILTLLVIPRLCRSYATTTRPISRRVRWGLLGLRVAAAGIALIMLARPALLWTTILRERARVGILVDTSQSMNIRDVVPPKMPGEAEPEPVSRLDACRRMLNGSRQELNHLTDRIDVDWMVFDARLRPADNPPARAEGALTALGRGVNGAREALIQTGSKIAGLILISDGRDTSSGAADPLQAGDELAVAGIPLFCVGAGNELPAGQTRSLTARRLDMADRVTVLNELAVGAEFLASGLAGVAIDIRLKYDGHIIGTKTITPTQVRELIRADLSHVPKEGGLHQVTVVATVPELGKPQGEARLSRYVRVTDDKVQVLYIDRARYERAAVARALEYAKEINLTKVDLNRPPDAPGADLLPQTNQAWRVFHVVIIGDVSRAHLSEPAMRAVSDLVQTTGRGAAILGGVRTLGSGEYKGSPLDALFPVDLATEGQLGGSVALELAPAGMLHPCCSLGGSLPKDAWKQLPPLAGASRLGPVEPTAEVLMRTGPGEPLMVVQQKGAGRTAVLAFDSTWQWPFASDWGLELHRRFWRQLVLWLANRKPEVWVLAERSQYDLGRIKAGDERIVIRAGINDPTTGGLPAQSALTGEIIDPDGRSRPLAWSSVQDGFEARPTVDQRGQYRVRVEGKVADQSAGESETAFVVESVDRELSEPFADLETLKRMAARTASIGGAYVPMEEFGSLLERLRSGGAETRITRVHRHYLVDDHPWLWLALFVGLLTLEWIIRRRVGLV
jgi:hypothetical protein